MNTKIVVACVNSGSSKLFPKGTSLNQVVKEFCVEMKSDILGALVNNELRELSFEVFHPVTVQFIDINHPEGMRMYTRGLSFLLYKAVHEHFPEATLRINHSISK